MILYVPQLNRVSAPISRSRRAHRVLIRIIAALIIEVFRQVIAR